MTFRAGWRMSLFVLIFLPVTLGLGAWQLERANYKRSLEDAYFDALGSRPAGEGDDWQAFSPVRLRGRYVEDRSYLVDNQIVDGEVGYFVVTVFETQADARYLINRGFLAAPRVRKQLPEFSSPQAEVTIAALAWPELGMPPIWQEKQWSGAYPRRIQRLDIPKLAEVEGAVRWQLRLERGQPGGLTPTSLAVDFNPARHTGYAVQWFGLAAALLIGFVVFGRIGGRESNKDSQNG